MNRRGFLKTAAILAAVPVLPDLPVPGIDWTLRIRRLHVSDDFVKEKFQIVKGPVSVVYPWCSVQDMLDLHGICATDDLTQIVINDLEHPNYWKLYLERKIDCSDDTARQALWKETQAMTLTPQEKNRIFLFIDRLRGEHNCVHRYHKTRSRYLTL